MRLFLLMAGLCLLITDVTGQQPPYRDLTHNSRVFGHPKTYRLYLPEGYDADNRRYPVVYFFHGWGGRHFKDDNAKLDYTALQRLVNKYRVIMVMWDGNIDESEPRPYNIGNHEDVKFRVQMKDYFPELTAHIDSTFRTLTDRQHRGIIGFSMGGIMSLYLGGKYPDDVSAIVSIMGSPEFFIGYPERHTLYPVRYTFGNLEGVRVRIHTSPTDILYWLNEEVRAGAAWEGGVQPDYQSFEGGHMVDHAGETKVFESALRFVAEGFKHPLPLPAVWSHYDLYPAFEIRDYKVESNLRQPGFLYLRHVNKNGWGLYTRRWLPLGPSAKNVEAKITTPAIYEAGQEYQVLRYDLLTGRLRLAQSRANAEGRLQLTQSAGATETAIYREGDAVAWMGLEYKLQQASGVGRPSLINDSTNAMPESGYLKTGHNTLTLRLLNRGGGNKQIQQVRVRIRSNDPTVTVIDSLVKVRAAPGIRVLQLPSVRVDCQKQPPPHAAPPEIKLLLQITADGDQVSEDEMIVPVWSDAPEWTDIKIDDGRPLRDSAFGSGNGNGITEAGERIMLYKDASRLRLYTEDPWVAYDEETLADEIIPARWPDGFTLSSVIKIKPGCPQGHEIVFLASYETKTFNPIERKVHWGTVRIRVGHP
ncbi:alpha/beta hydrolase [Chitinophaga cymbidii]|uniref:Esterase n=1 Tax=Chitinophaga cymbidii TaxID=1096750 RepID=A0A512RN02_9BACT|nr:alpha/beta fold hydrolase [Chitinophaga cymbidii]GEP97053.1 hypothetical protein CCY01nite_33130 [Chitinophaga cymbidii]